MDITSYSQYYSFDHLIEQLDKNKLNLDSLLKLNIKELFNLAIKHGLTDLVEYLYVCHNLEYEVSELYEITTKIESDDSGIGVANVYAPGANSGLNLQYFSPHDINIQKSINKLTTLRKYSTMRSSNKKFYYKFNPKHKDKILCI